MAKKKQKAKKQSAKKQPPKKHKGKVVLTALTPNICNDFCAANSSQVKFQGIPSTGCTITQASATYPFSPVTGQNANGQDYTDLSAGDTVTIVVTNLNQAYSYTVSCCDTAQATHSVVVT
ncbi:MAG: hypothetical protein WCA49_13375 [Candidatus Sulfotelmatobacter sp.]